MTSFSICVPSLGRSSLINTLTSITSQMCPGDELLVDVNNDDDWAAAARNRMMWKATGDALLFMDDDDVYVDGAFEVMRAAFAARPDRPHIFRLLRNDGVVNWQDEELTCGNVGTGMYVIPNVRGKLGTWRNYYTADVNFIRETCANLGEPIWHKEIIYRYAPHAREG